MSKKTFKREVAAVLLLFWAYLTREYFAFPIDQAEAFRSAYALVTTAVFSWSAAAFSLDWYHKQLKG